MSRVSVGFDHVVRAATRLSCLGLHGFSDAASAKSVLREATYSGVCVKSDLRDLRVKITIETDTVLDALARVTGRDRNDVAREVLDKWAADRIQESSLIDARLKAEGLLALTEGAPGRVARKGR